MGRETAQKKVHEKMGPKIKNEDLTRRPWQGGGVPEEDLHVYRKHPSKQN